MPKIDVLNLEGKSLRTLDLSDEVFGIEPNNQAIFDAVVMQRASTRQGTHSTKNRTEVRGGGKKPWRQKGTGRARQGSTRSPQWRGGGTVFGPNPRSYAYKLPQKVRQLALKSVYSTKVADGKLIAVDTLDFTAPKTAEFAKVISALSIERKVLVVLPNEGNEFAELSARNLANVKVTTANSASVLDIVSADKLLVVQSALTQIEEVLA